MFGLFMIIMVIIFNGKSLLRWQQLRERSVAQGCRRPETLLQGSVRAKDDTDAYSLQDTLFSSTATG